MATLTTLGRALLLPSILLRLTLLQTTMTQRAKMATCIYVARRQPDYDRRVGADIHASWQPDAVCQNARRITLTSCQTVRNQKSCVTEVV